MTKMSTSRVALPIFMVVGAIVIAVTGSYWLGLAVAAALAAAWLWLASPRLEQRSSPAAVEPPDMRLVRH